MTDILRRGELAELYADEGWRARFLEVLDLVDILRECILEKNYKISDELNAAIVLTDAGRKVRDQMVTKEGVPTKEANVLTLLGLVHVEPLVDFERIDVDKLARAISKDVKSGTLKYPLIFGRDLYDRAAELFPEERAYLRHEDTLRLLMGIPQGVFQSGPFVVGPLGVLRSGTSRDLGPWTRIPLQHCSDRSCRQVHQVQLTTSIEAAINRNRPALNKVLDEVSREPSEWNGFVSDLTEESFNAFDVDDLTTVVLAVGDGLADDELSLLFDEVWDQSAGRMPARGRDLGFDRKEAVPRDRSTLMQLLLLESDQFLTETLNAVVRAGAINIPEGEVRVPRITSAIRSGRWGFSPQIGRRGVRMIGDAPGLPLLRLSSLASKLFDKDSNDDMEALSWVLRSVSGATVGERLAEFLRSNSPVDVVRTLALDRKKNVDRLAGDLHIHADQTDDELVQSIIWQLGFNQTPQPDQRDDFWARHNALERIVKTVGVATAGNADAIRSAAVNYFVSLETYLLDSVVFSTWALLNDHWLNERPFVFREGIASSFTRDQFELLSEPIPEKAALGDLVSSIARLAKLLEELRTDEGRYVRLAAEYPKFAKRTDLQKFPFVHIYPFLDLLPDSQHGLLEILKAVARRLGDSGIMNVRNRLLHAGREIPTSRELTDSLDEARRAIQDLEGLGCARRTFQLESTEIDAWGRGTTLMKSTDGSEISFTSPSEYRWLGLPSLGNPQYLVQGAIFGSPNLMLRFRRGYESSYANYWTNYPRWREPGNRVTSGQSDTLATTVEAGSFVGSRAD